MSATKAGVALWTASLIACPAVAVAQTVAFQGVEISLGDGREQVVAALERAPGITLRPSCPETQAAPCDAVTLMRGDEPPFDGIVGGVTFREGRVARASRTWGPQGERSQVAVVRAVLGALGTLLGREGASICRLTSRTNEAPGFSSDEVDIFCGERAVSISLFRYQGQEDFTISEYMEDSAALRASGE